MGRPFQVDESASGKHEERDRCEKGSGIEGDAGFRTCGVRREGRGVGGRKGKEGIIP